MAPPVQYATTSDGVSIAYWAMGSGAPLVFMPQPIFTAAAPEFELPSPMRWYERVSRHRRVIRFDHRGTGMSGPPVTELSLKQFELDLSAIVAAAGNRPVDIWAQEDAGPIAITFAVNHPKLVSHLILWDTYSRTSELPSSPDLHAMEGFVNTNWPMFLESLVKLAYRWDGPEANEYIAALQRSVPGESGRAFLETAWNWDVTSLLPSLSCPTLVLHRRNQPIFPIELSQKLAAGIAGARLVVVEGDSQFPWVGDAEACVRAYEEFVGEAEAKPNQYAAVPSEVRYARSGDVNIAYRVIGDGPFDVVFVPGTTSHVEFALDTPGLRSFLEQLASFARVIFFDKRGTGLSDAVDAGTPLEVRMDDVRAVMDAAESERAAVFGVSEGGPMSILFGATYPERAWALVLYGTYARELWAHDYPWGTPEADYRASVESMPTRAAQPGRFEEFARSGCPNATDEEIAALARYLQVGGSLGARIALARMNMGIDVRNVLGAIRIPTLVLHCARDPWVSVEQGRFLAQEIPSSTYTELDCNAHILAKAEVELVVAPIRSFLDRVWATRSEEPAEPDRVLATVLFTDIVGSSEHASRLGDRDWREKLEQHHELVRRQLQRHRGVEVDTAGDGFFASFDGPARAIRCASAITQSVRELGIDVRAGLHTGECELVDGKVAGIAVHTGARVASQAQPGEVLVSSTVRDLVAGSGIQFEDRGVAELKGIPGEWRLFAVAQ